MIKTSDRSSYTDYIYCTMGLNWGQPVTEIVLVIKTPKNKYYSITTYKDETRDITAAVESSGHSGTNLCIDGSVQPGASIFGAWGEGPIAA